MKRVPMRYISIRSAAVLFLTLALAPFSVGQVDLHTASLSVGLVGSILDNAWPGRAYVVYPEFQVGGQWFYPWFEWSTYWGYWDDGVDEVRVTDAQVYSTHGHIIGGRIAFLFERKSRQGAFPLALFVGASHHLAAFSYVGGEDGLGTPVNNHTETANALEVGARLYVSVSRLVELRAEGRQFFGFGSERLARAQNGRRAYTIGVAKSF